MFRIIIASSLLVIPTFSALSQSSTNYRFSDQTQRLEMQLESEKFSSDRPGYSLLVARGEEILLQHAAGSRDLETGSPVTEDTPFYIASIGKTFTAWAVLKLYEQKELNLDDKLSGYFPELPPFADKITVFHMLNHTSGLPDYYDAQEESIRLTNRDVLDFVLKSDSLLFEPGYDYAYSNTAYVLLAEIIEQVTGSSYNSYIREQFLSPLEMHQTVVMDTPGTEIPDRATGYVPEGDEWIKNDYEGIYTTGAGGMYSTAGDLFKWYRAIRSHRFLSTRTTRMAFHFPLTVNGKQSYMAMGWFNETFGRRTPEIEGLKAYGAIGVLNGFRSNIHFFPDHNVVFILLSNSGGFPVRVQEMATIYFERI